MGIFDILTGRRAPGPGVAPLGAAELHAALLGLGRPTSPVAVRDGAPEDADLVAEWRLADPRWARVFAEAGLGRASQVLLRLDDGRREVRVVDRPFDVEWRGGLPVLSFAAETFRARRAEAGPGRALAFREEDHRAGRVHDWRLDTPALKASLQEVVAEGGWGWRPVGFGRL